MRRSGLQRKTALQAKTPMKRGAGLARTKWNPPPSRDSAELRKSKAIVRKRSGGLCEVRLPGICTGRHEETNHIKPRARLGSHRPENLAGACVACHHHLTTNPDEAHA